MLKQPKIENSLNIQQLRKGKIEKNGGVLTNSGLMGKRQQYNKV